MTLCAVQGCEREATEVFKSGPPLVEWAVCEEHAMELRMSPYATSVDTRELIVGQIGPPRVLDIRFEGRGSPYSIVTLTLGRDGIEEERVQFFMNREDAKAFHDWFPPHPTDNQD